MPQPLVPTLQPTTPAAMASCYEISQSVSQAESRNMWLKDAKY